MSDHDREPTAEQRIEALLRRTGRRPAVPTDRAQRVRSAVRTVWRSEVHGRSRRRVRWLAAVAGVATAAGALSLALWHGLRPAPAARIAAIVEAAASWPGAPMAAHRPGDALEVGAVVAPPDGTRLAIRTTSGHSVRLDAGARVRLLSDRALALDGGAVYVDSAGPHGKATGPVEIRTSLGTLHDVGTQFEARLVDRALRVRVREGAVRLERADGRREVSAGKELEISAEGRASTRDAPAFGKDWEWVAGVTPMMSIAGRPVREFLDWMARERGLRLEFSTADLAGAATRIVLSGSIEGMTLDDAVQSVLPACRMRHRIEGDVLRIEPLGEPPGSS